MEITRSRNGCFMCRSRRVKCDERRPVCLRCSRSNLTCGYGIRLTWQEDNEARGVCHGRAGVWSKSETATDSAQWTSNPFQNPEIRRFPRIDEARFLNTTSEDVRMHLCREPPAPVEAKLENSPVGRRCPSGDEDQDTDHGNPHRTLSYIHRLGKSSQHDSMLLSFYESVVCSSSTLLDDETNNPYRHVLLPLALQSPGVYHATLAISANVLRLAQSRYAVIALDHRQQALRRLIILLNNGSIDSIEMDEMLGLVLMLCWFEITDGCSPSWVKHLKGFRGLIERHRQISSRTALHSRSLEMFFLRYFAFHLVLAKTTFHVDEPASTTDTNSAQRASAESSQLVPEDQIFEQHESGLISSSSTSFLSVHMLPDSMDDIDLYMGFSNKLLLLINEITDLTSSRTGVDNQSILRRKTLHLKTSLEQLEQRLPDFQVLHSGFATRKPAFLAIAETYRLGAIILLHKVVSKPHPVDPHLAPTPAVVTNAELQNAVQSILQIIDTYCEDMIQTAALPLWPLFLAGCCVDRDDDRMTALRLFETTEQQKRFGNVTPARKVMEMVWRQRDLGRDQRQPARRGVERGARVQYEWERASLLLGGWKISLT